MAELRDLLREYERARYPEHRRLDLHGEGPAVARERALHWIQSHAHEAPGEELLLIVARGGRPGRPPGPVEAEVRKLLEEINGKLIEWWQPFAPGSLALRVAQDPRMLPVRTSSARPRPGDGRTEDTAGAAWPAARADIPPELLDQAMRAAERRIEREGLTVRIMDVVLREIWIEAQAIAMEHRIDFGAALARIADAEMQSSYEETEREG